MHVPTIYIQPHMQSRLSSCYRENGDVISKASPDYVRKTSENIFFFFHALSSFQEALYPNWREIMFYMQLVKEGKNEKFLSSSLH